jgi:hypothetical protein
MNKPYTRYDYGHRFNNTTTPEYMAMNPNAKVATLVDGNTVIDARPAFQFATGAKPSAPAAA